MGKIAGRLTQMSEPPMQEADFNRWLDLGDALAFLRENEQGNEFVVYASDGYTFIHALLAPAQALNPPDIDDLMSWSCNPTSSWGITVQFSDPPSVWISPPLDHSGSKTLNRGEQLVFLRDFDGRVGKKGYYEVRPRQVVSVSSLLTPEVGFRIAVT